MTQPLIPLNSDTETQPSQAMRAAIASAEVGDEQQGRDPTVNLLQERVAALLGKEAALWLPSGTMCNFVGIKTHTQPADVILVERMAHIIRAESAGVALSSGVLVEAIASERGIFTASDLEAALDRVAAVPVPYGAPPRLVCVEQTHNFGGGAVWSLEELRAVSALARSRGLALHMDGARLANACAASGVDFATYAAEVDTVWIDFTKGLGAPIGAVLAGSSAFIQSARRQKHLFGGAMRQAGIAAAGCLHALDHHVGRLREDHARARELAEGLAEIPGLRPETVEPESNIVFFDARETGLSNPAFVEAMKLEGVRLGCARGQVRALTHLDIDDNDIERALEAAATVARQAVGEGSVS